MNPSELATLVASGERLGVEFKTELSNKRDNYVCKEVAAFATSNGGHLIIGISDNGEIVGLENARMTQNKLENLINSHVTPTPVVDTRIVHIDKKDVLVCEVAAGTAPFYMYDGRPYVRVGTSSARLSAQGLIDLVRGRPLEEVVRNLEASLSTAHTMASHAMSSPATAIYGQGELATMNYGELIERLFVDIAKAPAMLAIQSKADIANSMASYAVSAPARAIDRQGDLATMDYFTLVSLLVEDSRLFARLYSLEAVVNSRSASPAVSVIGQGELATMNYAGLLARLASEPGFMIKAEQATSLAAGAISAASSANAAAERAMAEVRRLEAELNAALANRAGAYK
jgi:hypothetical protein